MTVAGFNAHQVVCQTYYNVDGLGQTTELLEGLVKFNYAFDSAGRKTTTTDYNSTTTPVTQTNYDLDGHAIDVCSPRQFTDGGSTTCTSTGQYSTHTAYDPAGHAVTVTRYRGNTQLIASTHYDADGNPVSVSDPNSVAPGSGTNTTAATCPMVIADSTAAAPATTYTRAVSYTAYTASPSSAADTADESPAHTTITCYDLLDRPNTQITPAGQRNSSASTETITWTYDAAGDKTATIAPAGDLPTSSGGLSRDAEPRITAYSYDADRRVTDTITAASAPSVAADGPATVESPNAPGPSNQRTRNVYDADGNITTVYPPRAFVAYNYTDGSYVPDDGTPSVNTVTTPDPRYATVTIYDADDRPTAQYQGRYDTTGNGNQTDNLNGGSGNSTQDKQCPTTASGGTIIPSTVFTFFDTHGAHVGVCSTGTGYDADGNVAKATLATAASIPASNRFATYNWTDDALLLSETTPDPRSDGQRITAASYTYDVNGKQVTATDTPGLPTARTTTTSYTYDELPAQVTAPAGPNATHVTYTTYDSNSEPVTVTQGVGTAQAQRTTTTYTSDGLTAAITAGQTSSGTGLNLVTSYTYDNNGNTTAVTDPAGNDGEHGDGNKTPTTMTTYTPDNLVNTETRVLTFSNNTPQTTRAVSYTYDDAGRKVSAATTETNPPTGVNPDGGTQTFAYYPDDQLADQNGRATNLSEAGNTYTYGTDKAGGLITTSYDPDGNITNTADSTYANDSNPAVSAAQKLTASTAISTNYYFDDQLRNTISGGGQSSSYAYDGGGTLTERDSYSGTSITQFAYGDDGQPETENDNGMDPTGQTPATGSRNGTWKWSSYDALGRPLTESIPSQAVTPDGQNSTPNPTQLMQQTMTWNNDDTLAEQTLADLKDTSTSSTTSQAVNMKHADWTYTYDSLSRITSQALAEDGTAGQYVSSPPTKSNGALAAGQYQFGYDTNSRITSFTDITPGTSTSRTRAITYDADDNRIGYGVQGSGNAVGTNTSGGNNGGCNTSSTVACFAYNADDSLATSTDAGGTTHPVTIDSDGRQVDDGCQVISYDGFDRQHDTSPDPAIAASLSNRNPDGSSSYAKNCGAETTGTSTTNDPVSGGTYVVTSTGDTTSTTVDGYDALDRQRYRDANGNTTVTNTIATTKGPGGASPAPLPAPTGSTSTNASTALYNQDGGTQNVINQVETANSTGPTTTGQPAPPAIATSAQQTYVLDTAATPLAEFGTSTTTTGTTQAPAVQTDGYLTTDGNGNITAVTGHNGTTECATRYDPYGTPERPSYKANTMTDPDPTQGVCTTGTSTNEDWYQGARRDSTTGTYQFGTRTYDPAKGGFTTSDGYRTGSSSAAAGLASDPLTEDTYNYVNGDPLNANDPDGNSCVAPQIGSGALNPDCGKAAIDENGQYSGGLTAAQVTANKLVPGRIAARIATCQATPGCEARKAAASLSEQVGLQALAINITANQHCNGSGSVAYTCVTQQQLAANTIAGGGLTCLSGAQSYFATVAYGAGPGSDAASGSYNAALQGGCGYALGPVAPKGVPGGLLKGLALVAPLLIPGAGEAIDGAEIAADGADAAAAGGVLADSASSASTELGELGTASDESTLDGISCGNSFTPDTRVLMADLSSKSIDAIKTGDTVEAINLQTGLTESKQVSAVWIDHDNDLLDINVRVGATIVTIHATRRHLFWIAKRAAWVEAEALRSGDILTPANGEAASVINTLAIPGARDMWDLTVVGDHDFYLSFAASTVLVHNDGGPGGSGTVFNDGPYTFQIYANDHGPPHGHLKGPGGDVQLGQNGKPLDPDVQLTRAQQQVVDRNLSSIRSSIGTKMAEFRGNQC